MCVRMERWLERKLERGRGWKEERGKVDLNNSVCGIHSVGHMMIQRINQEVFCYTCDGFKYQLRKEKRVYMY